MPQLHDIQHPQCDSKIYTFVFLCVAPPFSVSIGIPFSHSLSLLYLNYSFLSPPSLFCLYKFSSKLSVVYLTQWDFLNLNPFKRQISTRIAETPRNLNFVEINSRQHILMIFRKPTLWPANQRLEYSVAIAIYLCTCKDLQFCTFTVLPCHGVNTTKQQACFDVINLDHGPLEYCNILYTNINEYKCGFKKSLVWHLEHSKKAHEEAYHIMVHLIPSNPALTTNFSPPCSTVW